MQQSINIFGYGLTQLFSNFGSALRLTGGIWLLTSLLIYAAGYAMVGQPIGPTALRPDIEGQMPTLSASFSMLGLIINVMASAWVVMIWSRFCLGADTPSGWIPALKGQPFGGVLITMILVVAGVGAAAFIASLIGSLLLPYMPLLVGLIVFPLITFTCLIWLALRIGAALPASAVSEMLSLTLAWNKSKGLGLLIVAILGVMTATILSFPGLFLSGLLIPGNLASMIGSWLLLLIGTGWLVAIYKHATETDQ